MVRIAVPLGSILACLMARTDLPGRNWLEPLILIPVFVSALVLSFGYVFALGPAGGLGWGFGAALGIKLATPDAFVVATLGDGAYMFANPMVGHWVAANHKLPILTIVFNNSLYGAVRGATMSMFKDGVAGEDGGRFMADLSPSPAFEAAVKAQGRHGDGSKPANDVPAGCRHLVFATLMASMSRCQRRCKNPHIAG